MKNKQVICLNSAPCRDHPCILVSGLGSSGLCKGRVENKGSFLADADSQPTQPQPWAPLA